MVEPSGPEFLVQRASVLAGVVASVPGLWLMQYLYESHAELGDVTIFALCMVLPLTAWALVQAAGAAYLRRRAGR
jgi:hypothetical protein